MAENIVRSEEETFQEGCFKEAVCISAQRVYDSCESKDCLEDLRVYFDCISQEIIDNAANVRVKSAKVIKVCPNLEEIAFNNGYYAIDLTYYFDIEVEVSAVPCGPTSTVCGTAIFEKKVILYGGDGDVKIFSSDSSSCCELDTRDLSSTNLPKAVVQVAEPIVLDSNVCEKYRHCECNCIMPKCVLNRYESEMVFGKARKYVLVTLGIFSIVQIERPVQMLIPVYDFCIPQQECEFSTDNPCDLFKKIAFPTDQFFPPKALESNCKCGCKNNQD